MAQPRPPTVTPGEWKRILEARKAAEERKKNRGQGTSAQPAKPKSKGGPPMLATNPGGLRDSKGRPAVSGTTPGKSPGAILAMQRFLKQKGYDISDDGVMGPETRAAKADWERGAALRNPKQWNISRARSGATGAAPKGASATSPSTKPGAKPTPAASTKPKADTKPKKDAPAAATPPSTWSSAPAPSFINPRSGYVNQPLDPRMANVGTPLDPNALNYGTPIDPNQAREAAGLGYDTQLREMAIERMRQERQGPQNIADIRNWYGQVLKSQDTAATRDAEINAAGQGSMKESVQGILASLGGSANEGAPMVGAAGAEAIGTLGALGVAQESYNQDIVPLLQAESAGAGVREMNEQRRLSQDIVNKVLSLQGEKAQAQTGSSLQTQQYNNELMARTSEGRQNALSYNNTLAQQKAQGRISIEQGNRGMGQQNFTNAMGIVGQNQNQTQQNWANQFAERQQSAAEVSLGNETAESAARIAAAKAGGKTPGQPGQTFKTATAEQKRTAQGQAIQEGMNPAFFDQATGTVIKGQIPRVVAAVNAVYRGFGWSFSNPAVVQAAMSALRALGITPDPKWYTKYKKKG